MDKDAKPKFPFTRVVKIAAITMAALLVGCFLAGVVIVMNVHTGADRDISLAIHREFKTALETNFNRQIDTALNTLHNNTVIYVKTEVSDEDKRKLAAIAGNISSLHSNRTIRIVYKTGY